MRGYENRRVKKKLVSHLTDNDRALKKLSVNDQEELREAVTTTCSHMFVVIVFATGS